MTQFTQKLFVLEASGGGRLFSINPDGSGKTSIVNGCPVPDGVAVDVEAGHVYWTNMGTPPVNDGSIERVDLDGGNRTTIVPPGGTYTPKQLHFDVAGRKLYWSDREGMRVMRCDLDGSNVETLVQTGQGDDDRRDETNWCVGVAVDHVGGHLYWTQKGPSDAGLGRILRAGIEHPRRRIRSTPQRHRSGVQGPARADRPRNRPHHTDPVLDRPWRPAARQHRQPRSAGRHRQRRTRNRGDPPDGRHRHRAGSRSRPHVRHRPRRQHLRGRPATDPAIGPSAPCKATSPVSPTPKCPTRTRVSGHRVVVIGSAFGVNCRDTGEEMSFTSTDFAHRPVAVIGAGTLGRRIALMFVAHGAEVKIYDLADAQRRRRRRVRDVELPTLADRAHRCQCSGQVSVEADHRRGGARCMAGRRGDSGATRAQRADLRTARSASGRRTRSWPAHSSSYASRLFLDKVTHPERVLNIHFYMPPKQNAVDVMSCGKTDRDVIDFVIANAAAVRALSVRSRAARAPVSSSTGCGRR